MDTITGAAPCTGTDRYIITSVNRYKDTRHALALVITRDSAGKANRIAVYDSASKYVAYITGGHDNIFRSEKFL